MPDDRSTSRPIDRALADIFVAAYKGKRMTQAQLVEATGIKTATMQRLMAGKSAFDMDQVFSIAQHIPGGRPAFDYVKEAEAVVASQNVSEAPANVTHISTRGGKREFEWQGEEHAYQEWDAVAKSEDSTIEINPDDHTP